MSDNILIVESKNDKLFFEALIKQIPIENTSVAAPICKIDDYECLKGMSDLKNRLTALRLNFEKGKYNKVGIILDADLDGIETRLQDIRKALEKSFGLSNLKLEQNGFLAIEDYGAEIGTHILNIDGAGELETILKAIKTIDSPYADCLENWRACLSDKEQKISDKDFDKFWVNQYMRFDICTKKEKSQANRKCNFEASMQKTDAWNFEHSALDEVKIFLQNFN